MNWLTLSQQNAIRQLAAATPEQESCGFVLHNAEVVQVPNSAPDPVHDFRIAASDYAHWDKEGIRGVWHSHLELDGFSPVDQQVLAADTLPWAVYTLASDRFHQCDPTSVAPLVGRPFVYGIYDCYSLVSDKLSELGAIIPPWPRGAWGEWDTPGFTPFDEQWANFGQRVSTDFRHGDVLFFNLGKHPGHTDHVGVVIEPGTFLHHPASRTSRLDRLSPWWLRHLNFAVRHQALWTT